MKLINLRVSCILIYFVQDSPRVASYNHTLFYSNSASLKGGKEENSLENNRLIRISVLFSILYFPISRFVNTTSTMNSKNSSEFINVEIYVVDSKNLLTSIFWFIFSYVIYIALCWYNYSQKSFLNFWQFQLILRQ